MITDGVILFAGVLAALVGGTLAENGSIPGSGAVIAVIALASSFGPTAALSALSNNLNHTLASGNRVLDILEEKPLVEEVTGKEDTCGQNIHCDHVSFAYANTQESGEEDGRGVLRDFYGGFYGKADSRHSRKERLRKIDPVEASDAVLRAG